MLIIDDSIDANTLINIMYAYLWASRHRDDL